ncbi:matrin 3-like 1.1 isoform X2 [Gouania willdenowi]|uniref:Matrin-3-like n=1 Tax=Gouania willdenowi TaxID=441366 RepID=A0A8C5DM16_GOUWI|nr:matrin-3-like isoform X2 [Gouania willdenowi]
MSNHFPRGAPDPRHPPADYHRSSSRDSASSSMAWGAAMPPDTVLSLLSSCGLEPDDLGRLAELPEDVLTVDALPLILQQMKKGGRAEDHPPSASSFSQYQSNEDRPLSSSSFSPYVSNAARPPPTDWEEGRGHTRTSYGWVETERVDARRNSNNVRAEQQPSVFGYKTDTDRRTGPSHSDTGSSHSGKNAYRDKRPRYSDSRYRRSPPPRHEPRQRPRLGSAPSSRRPKPYSAQQRPRPDTCQPSKKQALDFQGTPPVGFPYSCSLCDITVLSVKVWLQHVNSTQHADGQLNLLQQFPNWDCRIESSRDESQSERLKDGRKPTSSGPAATQQSNKGSEKKERGKVVCVKFPPQSVDETYLRKLTEPFGKILRVLMFPSLAFVELSTVDQARDLVKFHVNFPPTVNGKQMDFSISHTFSFLQNSPVVSFTPPPAGDEGCSELINIITGFGPPLYTLFLPSKMLVEMRNVSDAQKLVDHYSSNALRIQDESIKVSFSADHRSLHKVSSAKKYQEGSTKRSGSSSSSESKRMRTSPDPQSTSRTTETTSRTTETAEPTRSEEQTEEPDVESTSEESQKEEDTTEEKKEEEPKMETMDDDDDAGLSMGDSDIEGMEVMGEDDEGLEVDDEDFLLEETENVTDVTDEKGAREPEDAATASEAAGEEEEVEKDGENEKTVEEEEEPGMTAGSRTEEEQEEDQFPLDLENCITLDELGEDECEAAGEQEVEQEVDEGRDLSRVLFFSNLPCRYYTDAQFISLVDGVGTAVRYTLNRSQQEGFLEMSSSLEAVKAAMALCCNPPTLNSSKLNVIISHQYNTLPHGLAVQPGNAKKKKRKRKERQNNPTEQEQNERNESTETAPSDASENQSETTQQMQSKETHEERPEASSEQVCEPETNSASEAQTSPTPVGAEFVKPVVGYFCNLCQIIFADEDEAKLSHCSTTQHYTRYQEKTGKNPWTS